jgi:hypothetical protein
MADRFVGDPALWQPLMDELAVEADADFERQKRSLAQQKPASLLPCPAPRRSPPQQSVQP